MEWINQNNKIIGVQFGNNRKIKSYVYESDRNKLPVSNGWILADDELMSYIIAENRKYEIEYTGKFRVSLSMCDSNLFRKSEPVMTIGEDKSNEVGELRKEIEELKSQMLIIRKKLGI